MISRWRKARSGAKIITYHRVVERATDPWGLTVSPSNFRAQLSQLKRTKIVLPLEELLRRLDRGTASSSMVAITFDDGYLDNLTEAAPLLSEFDLPATLFLATGPMNEAKPYWWEILTAMVLEAGAIEANLSIDGDVIRMSLPQRELHDSDRRGWRAWETPRTAREALYWSLWNRIRILSPARICDAIAQLMMIFPGRTLDEDRPMSANEVARLLAVAPVTLGGHTVDHPDLTSLHDDDVLRQMIEGQRQVADIAGRFVPGFAYPYGNHDLRVMQLAAAAGFDFACTTQAGQVRANHRLALPRMSARNSSDIDWLGA